MYEFMSAISLNIKSSEVCKTNLNFKRSISRDYY